MLLYIFKSLYVLYQLDIFKEEENDYGPLMTDPGNRNVDECH